MLNDNISEFLTATKLIEADNPAIAATAIEITQGAISDIARAKQLFYFIRDGIRYQFLPILDEMHLRASSILAKRGGYCTQKAILFCAMARSLDIPAGIHFYDIIDHSLPPKSREILGTNVLYRHGVATLRLNDHWIILDATLDARLCERNGLKTVEFNSDRDCLLHHDTLSGTRHIDYQNDYGLVSDVAFSDILSWFKAGYPHLVEHLI